MNELRLHLTGASGAGVTTLGRSLAQRLAIPHFDADDFYWAPVEPEFSQKRPPEDRVRLMWELFVPRPTWILSGSLMGWGDALVPQITHVILVETPTETRLARLRAREACRYGADAVAAGGARHEETAAFLDWASRYDSDGFTGRSRRQHAAWLDTLSCPVQRVDGRRGQGASVDEGIR
ncbi:MAG: adenylate kinase family enzyme, partial [Myxococcota bacterium]